MDSGDSERLSKAITKLLEHFNISPRGTPYDGLSLTDTAIIGRIAEAQSMRVPVIQKEIAEGLGLPKTTMASAVKRLIAKGLVKRKVGEDARARALYLTEEGELLFQAMRKAQDDASSNILNAIPKGRRGPFVDLLEKTADKLESLK